MSNWIRTEDEKPILDSEVEISDDGVGVIEVALYKEDRECMLKGTAPGAGIFSEAGFATSGHGRCEPNLILDDPIYWRYYE